MKGCYRFKEVVLVTQYLRRSVKDLGVGALKLGKNKKAGGSGTRGRTRREWECGSPRPSRPLLCVKWNTTAEF